MQTVAGRALRGSVQDGKAYQLFENGFKKYAFIFFIMPATALRWARLKLIFVKSPAQCWLKLIIFAPAARWLKQSSSLCSWLKFHFKSPW